MFSKKIIELFNKHNNVVSSRYIKNNIELSDIFYKDTSFLPIDTLFSVRAWYIRNNIYEQVKCPICKINNSSIDLRNNKIKACSTKCANNRVDPKSGLSKKEQISKKLKIQRNKINPKTGLTRAKEIGKKLSLKLNSINPKTNKTYLKEQLEKREILKSKINPKTGLTKRQEISNKLSNTLNAINPITGLSKAQEISINQVKSMLKKDINTGLTKYKENAKKQKSTRNKINPKTGLTRNKEISIKAKFTKRKKSIQEKIKKFPINYNLLTSEKEFINSKSNILKYKHNCGEIRESYWPYIRCLKCYPYNKSVAENEILEFCQSLSPNIISGNRQIIKPLELDIYIPNHNLAIEYDGLFWHSSYSLESEDKNRHLNKTNLCKEKGIQLFHIFENEWENPQKREIWKSIIRNKLGKSQKIFARKCEIKEVSSKDSKIFLNNNHLQGSCLSSINIGLYYESKLVSLMTFGKSRFNKKVDWELLRFCNKINYLVIGGASRLFKYFVKKYDDSVISYADKRYSIGNLYKNLGFKLSHESKPNYFYWKHNLVLQSRIQYQKHKLKDKLENFNLKLTESENMYNNGFRKIFDCGNQIWKRI